MSPVRRRALKIIGFGFLIAAAWIVFVLIYNARTHRVPMGPGLGLPLVPILVGLVELVSGRSFGELSRKWDDLRGWQRGLLGLAIVAIALMVIVGGVGMVLALAVG